MTKAKSDKSRVEGSLLSIKLEAKQKGNQWALTASISRLALLMILITMLLEQPELRLIALAATLSSLKVSDFYDFTRLP